MKRICVYCASSLGVRPVFADGARILARELVARELELVYGGAQRGIMGVIADEVLALGGIVHGVIPRLLSDKEVAHQGLSNLHVVDSMHARKTLMAELSDGFVALPGGFGTLEEIAEVLTWGQLQIHQKPCGVLNVDGYFDALLTYLARANAEGFLRTENLQMLLVSDTAQDLLTQFEEYRSIDIEKWL